MEVGAGLRFRLEPRDEYPHRIDQSENFNESMYVNLFDFDEEMGAWFRVGNRPNEGYTEVSCCLYLPDGRVGFMFHRPKNTRNDDFAAGGLRIEVTEPFRRLRAGYEGTVCVLKDPSQMADPRKAFTENPHVPCRVELLYRGVSPMFGGQPIAVDGTLVEEKPGEGFARAHYEQHVAGQGVVCVGDEQWTIKGLGLRDHSWGPRYWQNIHWYRWLPMSFSEEFAMMISIIAMADGRQKVGGMVFEDGQYHGIEEANLSVDYDENRCQTDITATVKAGSESYDVEGHVLSLIPLRGEKVSGTISESLGTALGQIVLSKPVT